MSILSATSRPVRVYSRQVPIQPTRRSPKAERQFGEGVFDKRAKHTAADEAWWLENTPTRHFDYIVLERARTISMWDHWHATAAPDPDPLLSDDFNGGFIGEGVAE